MNRILKVGICLLSLFCLSTSAARANPPTHKAQLAPEGSTWSEAFAIPPFESDEGSLQAVEIALTSNLGGSVTSHSFEASASEVTYGVEAQVTLYAPDGSTLLVLQPQTQTVSEIKGRDDVPFDGGASAPSEQEITGTATEILRLSDPALLGLFQGDEEIQLPVTGQVRGRYSGPGNVYAEFDTHISSELTLTYITNQGSSGDGISVVEQPAPSDNAALPDETDPEPQNAIQSQIFIPIIGN